ncbi:elongin-A-like isoform X3 [Sceloporus undulatus]|uniref:elongin-A-like isoform X3 n=1 Tax=Sceloporus undulatus TaxID=8520 RepID=UPI001C4B9447|nr:elongin-A-like isoform X3 [Sceloporus undulatus]XP_042303029.1 elongin-A-like isoform X3 [Sceloporus undulatus]
MLRSKERKHSKKTQTSGSNCNFAFSPEKSHKALELTLEGKQNAEEPGSFKGFKSQCNIKTHDNGMCKDSSGSQETSDSKNICKASNEQEKSLEKHTSSVANNQSFNKNYLVTASRKDFLHLEVDKFDKDLPTKQMDIGLKRTLKSNSRSQSPVNDETFEHHSMSFESYLNYDQVSQRRKRKSGSTDRRMAKGHSKSASWKTVTTATAEEGKNLKSEEYGESPDKKVKTSLEHLLNIPLPKVLPELSMPSPPYAAEFKAPPTKEKPPKKSEATQFTIWRRNSKVQVYSSSKMVCLSKMLTLYEQCIRVLQNNIDSLYEVGGVPFEILEPVLSHCTPEQLFRIESCNPTFVEETDHLWKRHCQKYFRNEQLLDCESWREMYLRLFVQREEKLKSLTKSIITSWSEKLKGCQVKMAFIHGMGKPPRSVCCQKVRYGTAAPVFQLQPKSKNSKNQMGNKTSSISNNGSNMASTRFSVYKNGPTQVVKKPPKSRNCSNYEKITESLQKQIWTTVNEYFKA